MNKDSRVLKTKGNKITSRFGMRTITYTSGPAKGQTVKKNHNGIDIVGTGSTLDYIVAHSSGIVQKAGYDSAVGYFVNVLCESNVVMVYYHMKKGSLKVKTGDKVTKGQVLGYMGATGNVTGSHLHFGIKVNGKWIDPEPYINADYPTNKGGKTVMVELPVLKRGSKGSSVSVLQTLLTAKGFDTKGIDNSFGGDTEKALKKYQTSKGLDDDGVCGKDTWTMLLTT